MLIAATRIQLYRIFLTLLSLLITTGYYCARAQQTGQSGAGDTAAALPAQGQEEQEEEEQRGMRRTYRRQRANPTPVQNLTPRAATPKRVRARSKGTDASKEADQPGQTGTRQKASAADDSFIGFTVWQMKDAAAGTTERRKLVKRKGDREVTQRPFRVSTDTRLAPGEAYVFSIESTKTGYLYIVDQEEYANGSLGEPSLIFPDDDPDTRDNRVAAGRVVEIPAQKTRDYFEAKQSGPNHVGEVLTLIVTPRPLIERAKIEGDAYQEELKGLLKGLQEKWGRSLKVKWTEVTEEIGKIYTEREGNAGAGAGGARLTDEDPLPQRLYQIKAEEGAPLMVNVRLRYDVK
jgi:Domain of unknown function (DUF4384)